MILRISCEEKKYREEVWWVWWSVTTWGDAKKISDEDFNAVQLVNQQMTKWRYELEKWVIL